MLQFLHLSDLHVRSKPKDNQEILGMLHYIKVTYPQHSLIITGDITHDGHKAQYRHAQDALTGFVGRVFLCPGNHDFARKGNLYSRKRAKWFDEFLSKPLQQNGVFADDLPVLHVLENESQHVLLIALNTNLRSRFPHFARGEVGEQQLTALERILTDPQTKKMTVIVFFHHHPFIHVDPFNKLLDAKELMRLLYGKVQVLLFGHHHIAKMWQNTLGIPYILAADNSPGKPFVREITVNQTITVQYRAIQYHPIQPAKPAKHAKEEQVSHRGTEPQRKMIIGLFNVFFSVTPCLCGKFFVSFAYFAGNFQR